MGCIRPAAGLRSKELLESSLSQILSVLYHTHGSSSFFPLYSRGQPVREDGRRTRPARIHGGGIHSAVIGAGSIDFACSSMFTPMLVDNSSSKCAAIWPVSVIPGQRAVQTLVFVDHFSQRVLAMIRVCRTRGSRKGDPKRRKGLVTGVEVRIIQCVCGDDGQWPPPRLPNYRRG